MAVSDMHVQNVGWNIGNIHATKAKQKKKANSKKSKKPDEL